MIEVFDLRCEYTQNPLGIGTARPRFSWSLSHHKRGQGMTAYQVLAASSLSALESGEVDVWNSGRLPTRGDLPVEYGGKPLHSGERVYWKVRAWDRGAGADDQGKPGPYSPPAWFETALLKLEDWQAEWIGYPAVWNGRALYFHKGFTVEKAVHRARVYVTGLGYYELHLNGQKVGDHVLDPGTSDYSKRVLYATYDVSSDLRVGRNVIGAMVGNGWYGAPKLLCQLMVEYEDGSAITACTGNGWQVTTGAVLENSIYGGEMYDARLEQTGWDTPEGESTWPWYMAVGTDGPGGRLEAQMTNPIRVVQTLQPKQMSQPKPGVYVYDMGQNTAGWARLYVQGQCGDQVTLKFAETVYEDGTVNQENLRGAKATDVYIFKGGEPETWEPRFTYHGFRYVQMEGYPGTPGPKAIEGRVVRSSVEPVGEFTCSNELLNRIYQMVWWTEYSNQHSIPTDCPQRDERMGWLNDLGARSEEAFYNFDMCRFMAKFVGDIQDTQHPVTGAITDTAPYRYGSRPADPVSVSYLLIPWLLYRFYGDRRALEEHYDSLKHWVDYLTTRSEGYVVYYSYYGDWAPPVQEAIASASGDSPISRNTPGALISTGYYAYSARLIFQMAKVLGKTVDAAVYAALADKIKQVYNQRFWDEASGGYGSNNQACNAFSLYMGLAPDERRERVLANLVRDVVDVHQYHLTTGNLCTKYLLEVLVSEGKEDVAYRLAVQTTYPSWGYMLANGATTLWERWEKMTGGGMNSHNHPMLGSVGAWFYKAVAGINLDLVGADPCVYPVGADACVCPSEGTAFSTFSIHPHLMGDLTYARAALKTVRGQIETAWERRDGSLSLRATVPVGSQAHISLPRPAEGAFTIREGKTVVWKDGAPAEVVLGVTGILEEKGWITFTVGSGNYHFSVTP
jgi:alpha-L-rhamnosidase